MKKQDLVLYFSKLFHESGEGFASFITDKSDQRIFDRLGLIEKEQEQESKIKAEETEPLTFVQLNQLFALGNIPAVSEGFFRFYWTSKKYVSHLYDCCFINDFNPSDHAGERIFTLNHLEWGLRRIMMDSLLFFGNINAGFAYLHRLSMEELCGFFAARKYDTSAIVERGEPLAFQTIKENDRFLISERIYSVLEDRENRDAMITFLVDSYRKAVKNGEQHPKIEDILRGEYLQRPLALGQAQMELVLSDIIDQGVKDENDLRNKFEDIAKRYTGARQAAGDNTKLYLSLVHDLDVFVAASLKTRQNFRDTTAICDKIFEDSMIKGLKIRYFDPTVCAADSLEDKGLIECLMVKCCKVLLCCLGDKEGCGKDGEAAMALSLGKPVIFLREEGAKQNGSVECPVLPRLIDFDSGVVNGAMLAKSPQEVSVLLNRIFKNNMQYEIMQKEAAPGYYILRERLTQSAVRFQTNNTFLSNAFWIYKGSTQV